MSIEISNHTSMQGKLLPVITMTTENLLIDTMSAEDTIIIQLYIYITYLSTVHFHFCFQLKLTELTICCGLT